MSSSLKPSQEYIHGMFDSLASRYDLFNRLTSMGLARSWRKEALKPLRPGMRVLDLGCGTGDLALDAIKKIGASGEVIGLDFSENMLCIAKERYEKLGFNGDYHFCLVCRKAEELPIEKEQYDLVVSGFVLRNLYENIDPILEGIYRSLKSGGQISFLDITEPNNVFIKKTWQVYMNTFAAIYGKILFGKNYPTLYLTESAKRFLKAPEFVEKLKAKGFKEVKVKRMMCGVIALYQGVK